MDYFVLSLLPPSFFWRGLDYMKNVGFIVHKRNGKARKTKRKPRGTPLFRAVINPLLGIWISGFYALDLILCEAEDRAVAFGEPGEGIFLIGEDLP